MTETEAEKLQRLWNETKATVDAMTDEEVQGTIERHYAAKAETIEEWAARTAPTHKWEAHHRVFEGGHSNDDLEAMAVAGLIAINERRQGRCLWSAKVWRVEAIETYRDKVAEGLSQDMRDALRFGVSYSLATTKALYRRGLWVADKEPMTPFGREIARVLEASHE